MPSQRGRSGWSDSVSAKVHQDQLLTSLFFWAVLNMVDPIFHFF